MAYSIGLLSVRLSLSLSIRYWARGATSPNPERSHFQPPVMTCAWVLKFSVVSAYQVPSLTALLFESHHSSAYWQFAPPGPVVHSAYLVHVWVMRRFCQLGPKSM